MNPVNGQIIGSAPEALSTIEDMNGKKIDFKRKEDISDDIVYEGKGSDGRTYSINLQRKSVIVSVYSDEVVGGPKKEGKSKEEEEEEGGKTERMSSEEAESLKSKFDKEKEKEQQKEQKENKDIDKKSRK